TNTTPLKSQKGVLVILTNTAASVVVKPRDAALRPVQGQSVDNKVRAELPPGVYDIEVSAAKYSPKKVAGIELGKDEAVAVELIPLVGAIQIGGVDPNASVLIDDQKPVALSVKKDDRVIEVNELAAGPHKVRVIQTNQSEWSQDVQGEGGRTRYVAAEFKVALVGLVVKTEPEAEIYIDENYSGRANEKGEIRVSNLAPGMHRIKAKKNEFEPVEKSQTFSAGPAELKLALNRTVFSPEFFDTFDEGPKFWKAQKTWQASPGKLKVQGAGIGLVKDTSYKDFRMEFDLTFGNGKGAVWVLRGQDESSCYLFQLTGPGTSSPNRFNTYLYQNGQAKLLKTFQVPENLGVPGDKFHIIVEASGPQIKHSIQVKSNPKATQPQPFSLMTDSTFSNGRVGFGTKDGEEFIVQFVSVIPAK